MGIMGREEVMKEELKRTLYRVVDVSAVPYVQNKKNIANLAQGKAPKSNIASVLRGPIQQPGVQLESTSGTNLSVGVKVGECLVGKKYTRGCGEPEHWQGVRLPNENISHPRLRGSNATILFKAWKFLEGRL